MLGCLLVSPLAAFSVVPSIVDGVAIGRGYRASIAWPAAGIVTGGISATICFLSATTASDSGEVLLTVGVGAVGALSVGLGIWALTLPSQDARIGVTPVAMVDARGQLTPGVGLTFAAF